MKVYKKESETKFVEIGSTGGEYLPLSGGTLSGDLHVNADVYASHQFIIPATNTGSRGCGIYETKDTTNLFGFLSTDTNHSTLNVGTTGKKLSIRGNTTRPLYSTSNSANKELALMSDVNAKYTKPSGGIPASDLAGNIPASMIDGLSAGEQGVGFGKITTATRNVTLSTANSYVNKPQGWTQTTALDARINDLVIVPAVVTDQNNSQGFWIVQVLGELSNNTFQGNALSFITGTRGATGATGATGGKGTDGVTPTITATASVDSGTGTPSVSVSKSGTNTNPSFKFAFSNLKGAKGDKGDKGERGYSGYGFNSAGVEFITGSNSGDTDILYDTTSSSYTEIDLVSPTQDVEYSIYIDRNIFLTASSYDHVKLKVFYLNSSHIYFIGSVNGGTEQFRMSSLGELVTDASSSMEMMIAYRSISE